MTRLHSQNYADANAGETRPLVNLAARVWNAGSGNAVKRGKRADVDREWGESFSAARVYKKHAVGSRRRLFAASTPKRRLHIHANIVQGIELRVVKRRDRERKIVADSTEFCSGA